MLRLADLYALMKAENEPRVSSPPHSIPDDRGELGGHEGLVARRCGLPALAEEAQEIETAPVGVLEQSLRGFGRAKDVRQRVEEVGVLLLNTVLGDDDGGLVVVRDLVEFRLGGACAGAEADLVVVLAQTIDGRRARIVEAAVLGDGASEEVDGRRMFNCESSVREGDRAVAQQGLEESFPAVVPARLEEQAEDGGVVAIPFQLGFIGGDGNVDVALGEQAAVDGVVGDRHGDRFDALYRISRSRTLEVLPRLSR